MSLKKYFLQHLPVFGVSLYNSNLQNSYKFSYSGCKTMLIVIVLCCQCIFFLFIVLSLNFICH